MLGRKETKVTGKLLLQGLGGLRNSKPHVEIPALHKPILNINEPGGNTGHLPLKNETERSHSERERCKSDSKPTKRKHLCVIYSEQSSRTQNFTRFLNIIPEEPSSAQV